MPLELTLWNQLLDLIDMPILKKVNELKSDKFQVPIEKVIRNGTIIDLLNQSTVIIPETEEEVQGFEKFAKMWPDVIHQIELLAQHIDVLGKRDEGSHINAFEKKHQN